MSDDYNKAVKEANNALKRIFPDAQEPDIFKRVKRGKDEKKPQGYSGHADISKPNSFDVAINSSSESTSSSSKCATRKISNSHKGGSSFSSRKTTGLSATTKAIGVVNNFEEAVIKFDTSAKGIRTSKHLKKAALYIARNGALEVEDSDGDKLDRDNLLGHMDIWCYESNIPNEEPEKKTPPAAKRFIMSAPKGTDSEALMNVAREFGKEFFKDNGFDYVFVLHCKSDDTPNEPDHPHVHFLINAKNSEGRRLNIRKNDLRFMRERFAALALKQGIQLNATSRAIRGKTEKSKPIERFYDEKRRLESVAENLQEDTQQKTQTQSQKFAIHNKKKKLKAKDKAVHPYQQERDMEVAQAFKHNKEIADTEALSKAKQTRQQIKVNVEQVVNELSQSSFESLNHLGQKLADHINNMDPVESSQQRRLREFRDYKSKSFIAAKQRERALQKEQVQAQTTEPQATKTTAQSQAQKWAIINKKAKANKEPER